MSDSPPQPPPFLDFSEEVSIVSSAANQDDQKAAKTASEEQYQRDQRAFRNQDLVERRDTHALRGQYAGLLFQLAVCWLLFVAGILLLTGVQSICPWRFHLSDTVLVTFITTTTASVLGLFIIAARWLFSSGHHKH